MDPQFWDYVRGITDEVPAGYTKAGCDLYRHLTYLGAHQMLESCFPEIREGLAAEDWEAMIRHFVATTRWSSNYYGDMENEFLQYLSAAHLHGSDVSDPGLA